MILIPPNGRITDVEIIEKSSPEISIGGFGEIFFRCYKFGYVGFLNTDYYSEVTFNVTYSFNGSFQPYYGYDELADPVIPAIQEEPGSSSLIWNLDRASEWKGYATYNINRISSFSLPNEVEYQYVIIVPESWCSRLDSFISWKQSKGLNVYVANVEWINLSYDGKDLAEKIREFIRDAFTTWHSRYFLLIGGASIIPTKYVRPTDHEYVMDLYYMCLDGDWDIDNDGIYGELLGSTGVPDADWFPEVIVGRLPADEIGELEVIIDKILVYEQSPPSKLTDWHNNFLGLCGVKGGKPGYYTPDCKPPDLNQTWLIYSFNLTSPQQVMSYVNLGQSVIWLTIHGSPYSFWLGSEAGSFTYSHAALLENGVKLPVIFALSCSTADFTKGDECIGVQFLKNSNGGAVAYYGSTFYGPTLWADIFFGTSVGPPWDPRTRLEHKPRTIFRVGLTFYQSISFFNAVIQLGQGTTLLGDPEMAAWTGLNDTNDLEILCNYSEVPALGDITLQIVDNITKEPLKDIVVRVLCNNTSFIELISDESGQIKYKAPSKKGIYEYHIYALQRNKPTKKEILIQVKTPTLNSINQRVITGNSGEAYFIFADPARMTRAVAAYDVSAGGILYGLCTNPQNQGLDTNANWVSQSEVDIGKPLLTNRAILLFGGPCPHWVVRYYETAGLTPIKFVSEGGYFKFNTQDEVTVAQLDSTTDFNHEDLFVVEVFSDENGNIVCVIYGFDWKGTWAGGMYFKNHIYPSISDYTSSYYIFHWIDVNNDGIPQTGEITLESEEFS